MGKGGQACETGVDGSCTLDSGGQWAMLLDPFAVRAGQAMRGHKEQSREKERQSAAGQDVPPDPLRRPGLGSRRCPADGGALGFPCFQCRCLCFVCLFPLPLAALTPW